MLPAIRLSVILSVLLFGISVSQGQTTYTWGGATGNWNVNGNWVGGTAPAQAGNAADTVEFANHATSTYSATYIGQPALATAFNLDTLILGGGATTASGSNLINRNEDIFHNLKFVGGGGGIVNSTSNGVGYTVDMAIVTTNAGSATLNLSGNGTSVVSLNKGVLPDVAAFPLYDVSIVKTGTSTFELNGTIADSLISVQEGAVQFGSAGQASVNLINLGHTSGAADARIILNNGAGLANTGDITVVHSADGGMRMLESTATGSGQSVSVAGDIAINHSAGLKINSGSNDAVFNLSGAISGSGDLIVTGTGCLYSSGSMSGFSGEVVVESGCYIDAGSLLPGGGSTFDVIVGNGGGDASMGFSTIGGTYSQDITVGAGVGGRDFSITQDGTLIGDITFDNRGGDFIVADGKNFVFLGNLNGGTGGQAINIDIGGDGYVEFGGDGSGFDGTINFGGDFGSGGSDSSLVFRGTPNFDSGTEIIMHSGQLVFDLAEGVDLSPKLIFSGTYGPLGAPPEWKVIDQTDAVEYVSFGGSIFVELAEQLKIAVEAEELRIGAGSVLNFADGSGINKTGLGTLTLQASSGGPDTYNGVTTVSEGSLVVNRNLSNSGVSVSEGALLGGSGSVGSLSGGGTVAPGNSPGIMTNNGTINPSGGLDFIFEITALEPDYTVGAGNSLNDILRLTLGSNPFTSALTNPNNEVTVNFTGATPVVGQVYLGGFYTDSGNYFSSIQGAKFNYTGLGAGQTVNVSMVGDTAEFTTGVFTNGFVTRFEIVAIPEPSRALLLALGFVVALLRRRRVA